VTRVLVTGASGFIGHHTLEPLLAAGFEVHAVTSRAAPQDTPAGVVWHVADLLREEDRRRLLAQLQPAALLHLAWYATPGRFWRAPENLDWLAASVKLLQAFGEYGGSRAVIAGTCAEYAWEDRTHCDERTTPTRPATLYGAAKHALHVVASAYAEQQGMALAWGRVFFVFGPGEPPGRLASSVAMALADGREALCTHGEQVRDFLYAPELAAAFVALLNSDVAGPVNLASGTPMRIRDLIAALAVAAGRPDLVRLGALPAPADPTELTAAVSRLRDEVGWSPSVQRADAAQRTFEWWQLQRRSEVIGGHQ
jgi:nucleoside-diphosphate-sugar epimerase